MNKKIFLNSQEFHFKETNLPLLIQGEELAGASFSTVSAVADLFSQGSKMVFLSGYPMARETFLEQTEMKNSFIIADDTTDLLDALKNKVIFLLKEYVEVFIRLVEELPDINERVILIKNIDLFPENVFTAVKEKSKVIYSGDVTKTSFKDALLKLPFKTKVFYSPLEGESIPSLEKYQGYLKSQTQTGFITLEA